MTTASETIHVELVATLRKVSKAARDHALTEFARQGGRAEGLAFALAALCPPSAEEHLATAEREALGA